MKERRPFQGVTQIARYNARFYLAAPFIYALLMALAKNSAVPRKLGVLLKTGGALSAWWTAASLIVSHWVYDRSPLYRWRWIERFLNHSPNRWANLHCGLDESSATLRDLFPQSAGDSLDFFDADFMSEPAIAIARREHCSDNESVATCAIDFRRFPQCDHCYDTIFLIFSAHEIRRAEHRAQFFEEVHRVLCPQGQVLLVEHPRNVANFAAFGPGVFHFYSGGQWQNLARESGFAILKNETITPFVRVWLLVKP
jgi:SAM-dependent methyltransferase